MESPAHCEIISSTSEEMKKLLAPPDQRDYHLTFLIKLSLTITISSFIFGYEVSVLNISQDRIVSLLAWGENRYIFITLSNCCLCISAAIGAFISGRIVNYLGRRCTLIQNNFLLCLGISINIIPYTLTFIIGRAITGFCVGINSTVPPIYINEISPTVIKGRLGILIQLQIVSGILTATALGAGIEEIVTDFQTLIILFLFPIIPIVLQNYILMQIFYFDTPQWLFSSQRISEVEKVLQKIYKSWAWQKYLNLFESDGSHIHKRSFPLLSAKALKNPMGLSYILCFLQQFSGINVIIFYSKMIFKQSEAFHRQSSFIVIFISSVNFLLVLPTFFFIKKYGRKKLLLQGLLGMSMSFLCYCLFSYFFEENYKNWVKLGFMLCAIGFYETSLGPVIWIYITEILSVAWLGNAITVQWISAAAIASTYPVLFQFNYDDDLDIFFASCSAICFFGFIFVFKYAEESGGGEIDGVKETNLLNSNTIR